MGAIAVKTPDKYRFSLQWGVDTAEKVQAGEFLESLVNKKSEFVMIAVLEYLCNHPEVMSAGRKPQIVVNASYTKEQLKAMIHEMMADYAPYGSGPQSVSRTETVSNAAPDELFVDEMIKNLDLF